VTLADRLAMAPAPEFPIHLWREVSRQLARIHNELRLARPAPSGALPWVVRAEQPSPAALAMLSLAGLRVLEIIQGSSTIAAGLGGVGGVWNCVAVMHGDIRPQNILLRAGAGSDEDIRFVDWEMQGVGDPAWDLAGLIAGLIAAWLSRSAEHDPAAGASFPSWATFQASCRALWQGYADGAAESHPEARTLAILAAARLIQIAVELTVGISELPAVAVLLLQLSENMFADPARAASELLAIG
jgi:Ser/Thr protein kinase RdoA (MazF antagonist)